jgi:ABC-2 type transport system permease protein
MRLLDISAKTFKEQLRSGWDLILSISLAPVFIVLYWLFMGGGASVAMNVVVIDHDTTNKVIQPCAQDVIDRLKDLKNSKGEPIFTIQIGEDEIVAEKQMTDGKAIAAVVFPNGYSEEIDRVIKQGGSMAPEKSAVVIGDPSQIRYPTAAVYIISELEGYVIDATGRTSPFTMQERFVSGASDVNDFSTYIPGLLIAAITMLMFSVSITVARDIENGTARRLILSRMSSFDLMGGVSIVYTFFSLISVLMAFGVAILLGYHYAGSLGIAIFLSVIASISVIAVGLITASFARTVGRAAIIVNFPLLILMFFSGAIFPLPSPTLFSIGERAVKLFDFLPTSHAVSALNQVLGKGAGLGDVGFEILAMLFLSAVYAAIAVWLFRRLQMR